jgi:hypothetical protein
MDENDPLWKITLLIAKGDRKAAMKMLEDPDELMRYPEIMKVMQEQDEIESKGEAAAAVNAVAEKGGDKVEDWECDGIQIN